MTPRGIQSGGNRPESDCRLARLRLHSAPTPITVFEGISARGTPVHLSHGRAEQVLRHQEGSREPASVVLSGRQDRHPGPERRRQVDRAEDHGRPRQGVVGRSLARRGRDRRLPGAGAGARPGARRVRQRHGRRRQEDRHHRALQRADDELFRRDGGRGAQAPGRDGPPEPVGSRAAGRDGDGSAGLPAQGSRRDQPVGRRAPPRGAVQAAALASPTCCCSTSRPTISTPKPRRGWKSTCAPTRAR